MKEFLCVKSYRIPLILILKAALPTGFEFRPKVGNENREDK